MMVSPYIQQIHDWKIREIVLGFLESKALFEKYYGGTKASKIIPFNVLRKLCDSLYEIKENHHLIFRKMIDPKKQTFEVANKFTPNESEINSMNTIGLLFHKVMVARELKYVIDYYEEDTRHYQESLTSLKSHLIRINDLLKQGINDLKVMLKGLKGNIYLTTYFLENPEFCSSQFDEKLSDLLGIVSKQDGLEKALVDAARFYQESGWIEKSRKMCDRCLEINPENSEVLELLHHLEP